MLAKMDGGKWDKAAEAVAEATQAEAVVVVVVKDGKGGCSVVAPFGRKPFVILANYLRALADMMEADAGEITDSTGEG